MICENCELSHDGEYGSGRFCSSKCARCFSTKKNRDLINSKVSNSLRTKYESFYINCSFCKKKFHYTIFNEAAKKLKQAETVFCSVECFELGKQNKRFSPQSKKKMSIAAMCRIERGERWFGTQTIASFRGKQIRCDSLLEKSFIHFIEKDENIFDVSRSSIWIEYEDNGVMKRYNPDFILEHIDGTKTLVEVKSERVGKSDVWEDYREKSIIKKDLLIQYANLNNMKYFWYTQNTAPREYKKICKDNSTN